MFTILPGLVASTSDSVSADATSIPVNNAAQICGPLGSNWTYLTLSGGGRSEQVKVTGCNGSNLEVERAIGGVAHAWSAGVCIKSQFSKEVLAECLNEAVDSEGAPFEVDPDWFSLDEDDGTYTLNFNGLDGGIGIDIDSDGKINLDLCNVSAAPCVDDDLKIMVTGNCGTGCVTSSMTIGKLCAVLAEKGLGGDGDVTINGPTYQQGEGISITNDVISLRAVHTGLQACGISVDDYGRVISIDSQLCGPDGNTSYQVNGTNGSYLLTGNVVDGVLQDVSEYDIGTFGAGILADANAYADSLVAGINTGIIDTVDGNCGISGSVSGSTITINQAQRFGGLGQSPAGLKNCWLRVDECGHVTEVIPHAFTWMYTGNRSTGTELVNSNLTIDSLTGEIAQVSFENILPNNANYHVVATDDNGVVYPGINKTTAGFQLDLTGSTNIVSITVTGTCG